jgi:nickel superoxide dismutase
MHEDYSTIDINLVEKIKVMKKTLFTLSLIILIMVSTQKSSFAHCEIPCGIYNDSLRVELIKEHIGTIEKSIKKIQELTSAETKDYNQITRWVNNKEEHANKIQDIISQYFMHQRIKPKDNSDAAYNKYIEQLTSMHQLAIYAMKSKQTVDLIYIGKMQKKIETFEKAYFHKH